jgi:SAM-dependent methyltransferase
MSQSEHWNKVYSAKAATDVSWYQPSAQRSRQLIGEFAPDHGARIVDVGAGSSALGSELLAQGYRHVIASDFSESALAQGRERAGEAADHIEWRIADATHPHDWPVQVDVWHDRALFHFLQTRDERRGYVENAYRAVKDGGHLIIATFSLDGPPK